MARVIVGLRAIGLALVLGLIPVYGGSVVGATDPPLRADLEGQPIPLVEVGLYACHDLDFPRIHCFNTAAELDAAVADWLARPAAPTVEAAPSAVNFVKVFPDKGCTGLPAYFAQAYDDLSTIGWNDRISSFQSLAAVGGRFWEHSYGRGVAYPFDGYELVTYVGDAHNDTFSSVYPQ